MKQPLPPKPSAKRAGSTKPARLGMSLSHLVFLLAGMAVMAVVGVVLPSIGRAAVP